MILNCIVFLPYTNYVFKLTLFHVFSWVIIYGNNLQYGDFRLIGTLFPIPLNSKSVPIPDLTLMHFCFFPTLQ